MPCTKKIIDKVCEECKIHFKTTFNQRDKQKFCSQKCSTKYNNRKRDYSHMMDSRNPAYKDGRKNYRKKALNYLDVSYCHKCKKEIKYEDKVIIHHKDFNRLNNLLDNLLPVCYSCHEKIHDRRKK